MTELDLLKEMCDSVPPQREQSRARARSRLLAAAGGTKPAAARRRPPARARLAVAGSAVAVTVVVVAVLARSLMTDDHGYRSQPASAAELLRLAAAAPAPPAPRPDQFIYVKSMVLALMYTSPQIPAAGPSHGTIRATMRGRLARFTEESWTSVNGTRDGLVRERPCELDWLPVHNQWVPGSKFAACEYSVSWGAPLGQARPTPNPPFSYGWEASLPTSRAGLTRYLERLKAPPGTPAAQRIWRGIYYLFQDSALLPASLRTAVYELAASLPGVRLIPDVADAAGRTGDAIALDYGGFRQELIFQPQTYQLLGIQETLLTPASAAACAGQDPTVDKCDGTTPLPAGAVVDSEAYLQVSVTDSTPPLPPNGAAPLGG